jgi:hypothetical protein
MPVPVTSALVGSQHQSTSSLKASHRFLHPPNLLSSINLTANPSSHLFIFPKEHPETSTTTMPGQAFQTAVKESRQLKEKPGNDELLEVRDPP